MPETHHPPDFSATLGDPALQFKIYSATGRLMDARRAAVSSDALPEYQELRDRANELKRHTLDHLDHYLEEFAANVERHGGTVVFCADSREAGSFVAELARAKGVSRVVKSKSMTTEELHLNRHLESAGLETVETDLGEFIIQLLGERPYHIVAPALHLSREDVADVFTARLGVERESVPERQTMIARAVLREKFLAAGLGITGANFLVADSGAAVVVENEGNARLTATLPRIHVVIAGIEKLIPRARDLAVFLPLLTRSATGQLMSVYTSFFAGKRRAGELDGPDEFYVLLIDNGRTRLLGDREKRESLYCIRCGACLNHCPVYRKVGGHHYPWVYSGPIGAVITPQFLGAAGHAWLPFASSLCGACGEVCPVKIDLPGLLLALRRDINSGPPGGGAPGGGAPGGGPPGLAARLERLAFRLWAWVMRHPWLYEAAGLVGAGLLEGEGWLRQPPLWARHTPLAAWLSQRDLPRPAAASFRAQWRRRPAHQEEPADAS